MEPGIDVRRAERWMQLTALGCRAALDPRLWDEVASELGVLTGGAGARIVVYTPGRDREPPRSGVPRGLHVLRHVDHGTHLVVSVSAATDPREHVLLERFASGVALALQGRSSSRSRSLDVFATVPWAYVDGLGIGVMAVGEDGRILRMNPVASHLVSRGEIAVRHERLKLEPGGADARLRKLVVEARPGAVQALAGSGSPLVVVTRPVGGTSLVQAMVSFVGARTTPGLSNELLRDLWDLTPTEASIVADLALGLRPRDVVRARSRSISTVRTHLKSVFRKTGVPGQAMLLQLLGALSAVVCDARPASIDAATPAMKPTGAMPSARSVERGTRARR